MSPAKAHKPPKPAKDADAPKPPKISHAEAVAARDAIWDAADRLFKAGWK